MNPMRMRPIPSPAVSRRVFLKSTAAAGAGLSLAIYMGEAAAQMSGPGLTSGAVAPGTFEPNAFLRIGKDNTVTVVVKHLEMGQGTYTGLPTLVAEELDAAWAQVRVEGAPADAKRYNNLLWGPAQGTGGSTAMANSFEQYRQAGAAARAMLVAAAAANWKVPADAIVVKGGVVSHASGKKASFGELADAASKQAVPATVKLKDAKDFVFIGKSFPRTDSKAKSNGTARFTQDVKMPEMLTALVLHAPRFGQKAAKVDSSAVSGIPGVRFVIPISTGVAVVATTFWAAKKGRDALKVEWDEATGYKGSTDALVAEYRQLVATPGKAARNDGDATKALDSAAKKLDGVYEFPYLAHAAMEPMNCVVKLTRDSCEVWNGEQFQTGDQFAIAKATGLKPEQVRLNMLFAGGSFGRRASSQSDYILEAVNIAIELVRSEKIGIPVKLVWTREDDMKAGFYRPLYVHALKAGLDANGKIVGWHHRVAGTVDPRRHGVRVDDGEGRHRPHERGRRVHAPLRHSRISPWSCTPRSRASRCCGGDRWAPRIPRTPPRPSSTSSPRWRARIPWRSAASSWASIRVSSRRSTSRRKRPIGASRSPQARPAASAGAAWRCTSRSARSWRRWPKSPSTRTASSRSIAWCARSSAGSP